MIDFLFFKNISISSLAFFGLFFLSAIAEIVAAAIENEKLRKAIKPLCCLFLFIGILLYVPEEWPIYLGVFFGLLGDIFFIFKKSSKAMVVVGAMCFLFNHVFFVMEAIRISALLIPSFSYPLSAIIFLSIVIFSSFFLKRLVKEYKFVIAGSIYLGTILLDVGWMLYCGILGAWTIYISFIGSLFFLFSDSTIVYTMFVRDIKKRELVIMSTYLVGQFLLSLGFLLGLGG